MAEVEEILKWLQSQKGVQGIIVNMEGKSTTTQYANLMHNLMKACSIVREIDPQNALTFLKIHSKKNEIMAAPNKDYFLIVIQNPTEYATLLAPLPVLFLNFMPPKKNSFFLAEMMRGPA
ncbi:PREDICTED: dynein light chain roadblock-type 1-like [Chrysochloris asiatica]|uniref:Dynein light chain roadblock-type 1-like n=1 Tax=Chrysochloris asiatica TaxID=185453 RepID=A0A9B0U045_CHRAS|nr:PREDICTED: dynein light chain roadblock-type 1-like [Chrysochloris asiatica]